tara:strand:+ start:382 stop:540 length:159 start_codon:yes stop_codon:yes gene_type:complete
MLILFSHLKRLEQILQQPNNNGRRDQAIGEWQQKEAGESVALKRQDSYKRKL